jgi:hypothetical protein
MFISLALAVLTQIPHIQFEKAVPDEHLNRLFQNEEGWVGADGAFSVPTGKSSSLWLFSDTWIGKIKDGSRVDAGIVNNTAAVFDGKSVSFNVRRSKEGKAEALVTPRDGQGWFWLGPSAIVHHKLYILLSQIVKTDESSTFGFKAVGQWLGVGSIPTQRSTRWDLEQLKVPFARFDGKRDVSFSFALFQVGSWVYIYGTDEDISPVWRERYLTVARCRSSQLTEFTKWEFWTGSGWSSDSGVCTRLVNHMASDGSVSYLKSLGLYVLVYSENGLSPRVLVRTAKAPQGPWSSSIEVYRCPEGSVKGVYCYQARNHPELANGSQLVISYCTNTFELGQVIRDAKLYFPRFIRVAIQKSRTN